MNDDADRLLYWDDELERLATEASAIHGEETVLNTTDRTLRQLVAHGPAPISIADLKTALKAELRRLVRAH